MSTFLDDVIRGLSATPKAIPSRYFYDERGDELFQQIMKLEEYYLPEAELEILNQQSASIFRNLNLVNRTLDIIELGAGDGSKTLSFLQEGVRLGVDIHYYPMDISPDILNKNKHMIHDHLPDLVIRPIAGNFFNTLSEIPKKSPHRVILFMGSNIGNLNDREIAELFEKIRTVMIPGDALLVAFDLRKSPRTILKAYDDSAGVTRKFNLNLLQRINRELDANFDLSGFEFYPLYDPVSGTVCSYLISTRKQKVQVDDGRYTFDFAPFEAIRTEISRKFSVSEIEQICSANGFSTMNHYVSEEYQYTITHLELSGDNTR